MVLRTSSAVAAELLRKALNSDLPAKEVRQLMQSLPLHIVQTELADIADGKETIAFATSAPADPAEARQFNLENKIQAMSFPAAAQADHLEHALNTDLPAKDMHALMKSLPVHVVQAVLGKFCVTQDSSEVVANVAESLEVSLEGDNMQEVSMSSDAAAAALLKQALRFGLPVNTMRLLKQSLPLHIVQNELKLFGQVQAGPVSATNVNDSDAQELFTLAVAADLPPKVIRAIAHALPLHVVQSGLSNKTVSPVSRL